MSIADVIDPFTIDVLRDRGGMWAAYENQDLGSDMVGHLLFLPYGPGKSFLFAPDRLPDTEKDINWRYGLVGYVDLESGKVVRTKDLPHPVPSLEDRLGKDSVTFVEMFHGHTVALIKSGKPVGSALFIIEPRKDREGYDLFRAVVGNDDYPGTVLKVWLDHNRITKADHDRCMAAIAKFEAD